MCPVQYHAVIFDLILEYQIKTMVNVSTVLPSFANQSQEGNLRMRTNCFNLVWIRSSKPKNDIRPNRNFGWAAEELVSADKSYPNVREQCFHGEHLVERKFTDAMEFLRFQSNNSRAPKPTTAVRCSFGRKAFGDNAHIAPGLQKFNGLSQCP
jgi:hypothetical protein